VKETVYRPNKEAAKVYAHLYVLYRALHDAFGTASFTGRLDRLMKDLIVLRDKVRKERPGKG